jgi:hypothetical protein
MAHTHFEVQELPRRHRDKHFLNENARGILVLAGLTAAAVCGAAIRFTPYDKGATLTALNILDGRCGESRVSENIIVTHYNFFGNARDARVTADIEKIASLSDRTEGRPLPLDISPSKIGKSDSYRADQIPWTACNGIYRVTLTPVP